MKSILKDLLLPIMLLFSLTTGSFAIETSKTLESLKNEFSYAQVKAEQQTYNPSNEQLLILVNNNFRFVLITGGLYAFSLIVIILLMRMTPEHEARDLVTIIGLISVIFGTILLTLMVSTTEALTAPMGILGAIAGYLFGATHKRESPKEE